MVHYFRFRADNTSSTNPIEVTPIDSSDMSFKTSTATNGKGTNVKIEGFRDGGPLRTQAVVSKLPDGSQTIYGAYYNYYEKDEKGPGLASLTEATYIKRDNKGKLSLLVSCHGNECISLPASKCHEFIQAEKNQSGYYLNRPYDSEDIHKCIDLSKQMEKTLFHEDRATFDKIKEEISSLDPVAKQKRLNFSKYGAISNMQTMLGWAKLCRDGQMSDEPAQGAHTGQ